jgi:hypothetical protein
MELVRKEVEFHNCKLIGIQKDGNIYTPINYFCDILGVNLASQLRKIKSDEAISQGVARMQLPTNGGEQEVYVLEISFLPLWLTGIKANQCNKADVREVLLDFKLKAKDVLAEAFMGKQMVEEEPNQLTFDYDENKKKGCLCE